MNMLKNIFFALVVVVVLISTAVADEKGGKTMAPEPVIVQMAKFPITVGGAEYDLLTIIQDFPARAGIGTHKHGGYVLVTVLSGEITLREKGYERVVKTGESWTENPGDVHAAWHQTAERHTPVRSAGLW